MSKTLKRILAMVLVICALLSYTVPAANAADFTGIGSWADFLKSKVTYNFNQLSYYTGIPVENDNTGLLHYLLEGYTSTSDSTVKTPMTDRYLAGSQNWTYEAASSDLCGNTSANEHLPNSNVRMLDSDRVLRIAMAKSQDSWIAFRIQSPGAGTYTMKLNFYSYVGSPTVACYILDAEGEASIDHDTVLARQERIQTEMDPNNRIGKVDQNAASGTSATKDNTAYIGSHTFEANKEYILVFETYETAAVPTWYACFSSVTFTKDGTVGKELTGTPEAGSILVEENLVPAADGGYMGAVQEVNGHDYFFLPMEGSKMAVYDLDKFIAGDADYLVDMVTTGLYYPTHATVTDDGKVIVGGDGRRMFIFDTDTMTGRNTPDFRAAAGLEGEGHNSSSFYNTQDKLIYFGTSYDGHMARYNMQTKTYEDLGDMVCEEIQELALGKSLAADAVDDTGAIKAIACYGDFAYGLANSDNYHIIVKYDLTAKKVVAALDVTEQISGGSLSWGLSVLGDKYLIAGASGASGMVLIDIASFSLVGINKVVSKGLFTKQSDAQTLWDEGVTGHATEVVDGKQYFFKNTKGMYSYDVNTGAMAYIGSGQGAFKTGAKTLVTLDRDKDGVEEQYLFSYAGGGQPRLFKPTEGKKISVNGLEADLSSAGGSSINIGDSYNNILYIGAWNNWNCVAYDTGAEAIKSRYVTGGQTDSQVSYVDDDGTFHLVSGNYSACVVYEIDPDNKTTWDEDGDSNIKMALISNMKQYEQKRIHTVAGGDGYVFAGTIPTSYVTGGGVGVYNRATGKEDFIRFKQTSVNGEKVVPNSELWDLAVQCIEYYDGRLFGTTTRSGGSGAKAVSGTSAQIFVMDYENMTIEATLDLRDYLQLPGKDANGDNILQKEEMNAVSYIGGIQVDDQGRFWGLCSDVLFCFTYDKTTKTFAVKEVLNLDHSEYETSAGAAWKSHKVAFDPANYQLFVSFYKKGLQQVVLGENNWNAAVADIDVASITTTQILSDDPATFALGANNNLYYASGNNLYMKPVNVTEGDAAWAKAQQVDDMLDALGDITADKADDVAAAKAAYNALSLREKALVQETRYLKEAEAQVLELQIEEAIANVTAGSQDELGALIVRYNELEADQQRYVQNITALEDAYDTAIELVDKAAQVQEQINTLPDTITLADEEAVVAARAEYDKLSDEQKELVDETKLLSAEARIMVLKGAQVVQAQIDTLPEKVTLVDEKVVIEAREAYDALSDEIKAEIDTTKLEAAEARLVALKAAAEVQAKINALPDEITLENEAAVKAARKAYNALTAEGQAEVDATKLVAAEAKLAELAAAVAVQTKIDALPDTVTIYDATQVAVARAAYEALTDALKATVNTEKLIATEAALEKVKKNTAPTVQFYNFELYEDPVFYTDCSKLTFDATAGRISSNFYASSGYNSTYATIADWFYGSYPHNINWGVETCYAGSKTAYTFRGKDDQGMRLDDTKTAGTYSTLRIFVPAAGLYQLDLKAGTGSNNFSMYAIPASTLYAAERTPLDIITGAMTTENQLLDNCVQKYGTIVTVKEWNVEEPGDYILIFKATKANDKGVNFRNMTLTPVIDETTAVAQVGEELFLSLEQAIAYQIENGAEKVNLFQDTTVGDLVLESGAVLDLNGKALTVDSVLSYASSAIIDSSEKDTGVLKINDAEGNMLSSNNAQLPIYDEAAGGLRFFEISVKSVATTGKGGANPKYWFQVSCVNFDELYQLIQAGSELNITVKMTWNGGEADAVAGADFLKQWADAFSNNESIYITVSAVNTEGLEDFSLIPALSANGVEICGQEL